jgi:pimeloyl-ACP methyl ester carboxylesterase
LLLFGAGVVVAYLVGCYQYAKMLVTPIRLQVERPEWARDALVPTRYGETPAWVSPGLAGGTPSKAVFVLVHGFGGSRQSWRGLMEELHKRGYDSVVPSMPGQDASPVGQVGFGATEANVVVDCVKWVRKHSDHPVKIVLLGVSLGGAACWLASAEDPTIDAVITESAFARFDKTMRQFFDSRVKGLSVFSGPVIFFSRRISGVDPASIRPIEAAEKWKGRPGLIIQAGDDTLVLPENGAEYAKATGCPLWIVPNARHARCYGTDPAAYVAHILQVVSRLTASQT